MGLTFSASAADFPAQKEREDERVNRQGFDERAAGDHVDQDFVGRFGLSSGRFQTCRYRAAECQGGTESRDSE